MDKELLFKLMNTISPSGREEMLQKEVYHHYLGIAEEFITDEQGTLTAVYNKDAKFKVMLAAHADEIGLIVTGYNGDGTLTVDRNGGIRAKLYVGTKVLVYTRENKIYHGVVGTNSSLNKKENVDATDLFVDLGLSSKEEAQNLIPKGSYIVHDTTAVELQNDCAAARAFDDRIGVFIIQEAAYKAYRMGAKIGILATNTTGEETTGRGAYLAASRLEPNICVSVDVTYATDYRGAEAEGDVAIGKGGVICEGSIPNHKLNLLLAECAKELNLDVQYEVFAGRTGTDSDTMLKVNKSIPQALFSIPLRYMHSPIEVLSLKDVSSMIDILALFLCKITSDIDLLPYHLD